MRKPRGWRAFFDRQVAKVILLERDLDLDHGHQAHVAIVVSGTRIVPVLLGQVGKGSMVAFFALDLAGLVAGGPVKNVERVPQPVGVDGPDLKVDKGRFVLLQVVDLELQRVVDGERIVVAHAGKGREIDAIGHVIVVVVAVKEVGRAVVVRVLADLLGR